MMKALEDGWVQSPLNKLTSLIKDGSHGTHKDVPDGVPLLSAKDVRDGVLDTPNDCRRISEADYSYIHKNYEIVPDDILLTIVGTIGRCCLMKGPRPRFSIQRSVAVIRPDGVQPEYLYHYFRSEPFQTNLKDLTNASAQGGVYLSSLAKCSVNFPTNKTEQAKIAEIFSTVDRAIEQTEALIAKQQRVKAGMMQDLLTRGIDERGNLRSEQTHKFKDSPLGRIPVEWEVLKWSQVCSKIQDGTHFSPQTNASAEFKYVTSKNIKFGYLDLSDVEYIDKRQHDEIYKRCDVCLGDVLLTKDGANTGNAAINLLNEEFSLLSSVALIRPIKNKLTSMFLLQTILSENGQRMIKDAMSGLAITRVTLDIINSFLMKAPPIQEQKTIGQILAVQDIRIESETKKLAKLRSLKTALMQDLLTGKKRVIPILEETARS